MGGSDDSLAELIQLSGGPCPQCRERLYVATQLPTRTARLVCANGHDATPTTATREEPAMPETLPVCEWFARCECPAAGTVSHPIPGEVPTCVPCAERLDLTFTDDTTTTT